MRKILVLFCFLIRTYFPAQVCHGEKVLLTQDGKCATGDWELVFEDEFDGSCLDLNKWSYALPWGNHSEQGFNENLQYHTNGLNHEFNDGVMKLVLKKEWFRGKAIPYLDSSYLLKDDLPNLRWWPYTSGEIYSKNEFGYGKYEIRCKIPKGRGFWSVCWLFGIDDEEIDVFEFYNEKNLFKRVEEDKLSAVMHMTIHANKQQCATTFKDEDLSKDFHTYTILWDNYKLEFYVDGKIRRTCSKFYSILGQPLYYDQLKKNQLYICDRSFPVHPNMHINVGLGAQPGSDSPNNSAILPAALEIDYIRYYKLSSD